MELPSMHWVFCLPVVSQLVQTLCTGMAAWLELMSKSKWGGGGEELDQVRPGTGQNAAFAHCFL